MKLAKNIHEAYILPEELDSLVGELAMEGIIVSRDQARDAVMKVADLLLVVHQEIPPNTLKIPPVAEDPLPLREQLALSP